MFDRVLKQYYKDYVKGYYAFIQLTIAPGGGYARACLFQFLKLGLNLLLIDLL